MTWLWCVCDVAWCIVDVSRVDSLDERAQGVMCAFVVRTHVWCFVIVSRVAIIESVDVAVTWL